MPGGWLGGLEGTISSIEGGGSLGVFSRCGALSNEGGESARGEQEEGEAEEEEETSFGGGGWAARY